MMDNVPGLADSGVKFFDQGALFQINALVAIREGVKNLSNELKEVLKEKETLETTVTKLKAENETLNKLLKSKFLEDRGPISLNSCLIVTEKFAQSLSYLAGNETDVIINPESAAINDLISKVHEARKKGNQVDSHKMAMTQPGVPSGAFSNNQQEENERVQQYENPMPAVQDMEMLPAANPTSPLPHKFHDSELYVEKRGIENVTSQSSLLSKNSTDHSNTANSTEFSGVSAQGCDFCGHSMTETEEVESVDISRVKTEPEPYTEQNSHADVTPRADEQLCHVPRDPQATTSVEETYLPSLAELDVTARDPIATQLPVYVLSSRVDDTVSEPTQSAQSELWTSANTSIEERPSRRGMEWKRGRPTILRRETTAAATSSGSILGATRAPCGGKVMIPRYKGSLYFNARPSMAGNKSSVGPVSIACGSGTRKVAASRPSEGRGESWDCRPPVKRYQCELCGKLFGYSQVLRTHLRTHTGEKPFQCVICSKRFSVRANWIRHKKTVHKMI